MTNTEKRNIARVIARRLAADYDKRKGIYLETLSDLGLRTNCCEEGICGGSPSDTSLRG